MANKEKVAPKRRGRPPKVKSEIETKETVINPKDVEALLNALSDARREIDALKLTNRYSDKPVVVVHHSGNGPQLVIPIEGEKPVVVDPNGSNNSATIPLSDYQFILKNTPWIDQGYLYIDGEDTDNPNLMLDLQEWFDGVGEDDLATRVKEITSRGLLNRLYDFTEYLDKTPKVLALRNASARRMEDLFDIIVHEDLSQDKPEN